MAVPVISSTQSVLVYGVGQQFTYQLTATNSPFEWGFGSSEAVPTGVFFDTLTGAITGAGTTPGIYNLTVAARNSSGWSVPVSITIGIFEPASGDVTRDVTINTITWAVTASDPVDAVAAASNSSDPSFAAAIIAARYGDDILFKVNFSTAVPLVMAKFALRGAASDPPFIETDELAFRKITTQTGSTFATAAYVYVSLANAPSLASWLEDKETETTMQNNVTCEFELELETPAQTPGPATQIITTRSFLMRVVKDTIK
jgi:hypothetical protein